SWPFPPRRNGSHGIAGRGPAVSWSRRRPCAGHRFPWHARQRALVLSRPGSLASVLVQPPPVLHRPLDPCHPGKLELERRWFLAALLRDRASLSRRGPAFVLSCGSDSACLASRGNQPFPVV